MAKRLGIPLPGSSKKLPGDLEEIVLRLAIGDLLERRPGEISGGQTMKVALARAFVRPARLYLFDEPLTGIDAEERLRLAREMVSFLMSRRALCVWVTHAPEEISAVAEEIVPVFPEGEGQPMELSPGRGSPGTRVWRVPR
jgi:ABC-type sugar transport system ATPase subunit